MPLPTWGDLQKSAVDPELVEEAINRTVEDHNDDPDSHLELGQSLQSHKASEIIDHIARSIVRDKLAHDRHFIDEHFSSIDGWGRGGEVVLDSVGEVHLKTTSVNNSYAYMAITPQWYYGNTSRLDDLPFWKSLIYLPDIANTLIQFGLGNPGSGYYAGFKVENSILYAVWIDNEDNEHKTALTSPDFSTPHFYQIEIMVNGTFIWTIDNVQVHSEIPVNPASIIPYAGYFIQTKTTLWKWMFVFNLIYDQNK